MLLILKPAHKQHLLFLTQQTTQVLQDFCKLALDYLQKGPNLKLYNSAAQCFNEVRFIHIYERGIFKLPERWLKDVEQNEKLEVEPEVIKNSVQGLVNFFLESCRYKLNVNDFRDSVVALGFTEEQESLFSKLYAAKKQDISKALAAINSKSPQYQDMEWRFEAQVASRSSLNQAGSPLVTLDFSLISSESSKEVEHVFVQSDPSNLLHLVHELEVAMQEGRSQHIRSIARSIK